ncbi:MAG: hypothetical protein ACERLM_15585, partial [Acidimicrobiales bacterium]
VVVASIIPGLRRYFEKPDDVVSLLSIPVVPHLVYASLLAVVALVGATLAIAPAFAAATTAGAETASSTPAGPIALTADAVTWDEGGKSGGDDDHLGPGGSSGDNGAEFTTNGYKWERTDLTYGFDNWTPDLSVSQQKAAVGSALNTWAEVTP